MSGEKDLVQLIRTMQPILADEEYVFTLHQDRPWEAIEGLKPKAMFNEKEGVTLILLKQVADQQGIPYQGVFKCITLTVHSSLEAVGLTAAISTALTTEGISANVIAGYFHDHIFVPNHHAEQAALCLSNLAQNYK